MYVNPVNFPVDFNDLCLVVPPIFEFSLSLHLLMQLATVVYGTRWRKAH